MEEDSIMNSRTIAICAVAVISATHALQGQGLPRYRDFELGHSVTSVLAVTGVAASEVKVIHQRPAVLQDLEWRTSRWMPQSSMPSSDPVSQLLFSFYNDQLYRIVVDYGRERTEGMTGTDMVEAVSAIYGAPLPRTSKVAARTPSRLEVESGSVIARWGDSNYSVTLYRASSYGVEFHLFVTELRLEALARKAAAQALRLDAQEAPAREFARQRKERDDGVAAAAKARAANKQGFRP